MGSGVSQQKIPVATIGRPEISSALVGRPALIRELVNVRGGELVVVSAPAGYGKTSDMALWDDADSRRFAWLRLDHLDDDPVHLLVHIASAVDLVEPLNGDVLQCLEGPSGTLETELMCALATALEDTEPIVIVIDDSHGLTGRSSINALRELVDILPATTTVVLVGRGKPPVDVARRRLHGNVIEIGTPVLSLDHDGRRQRSWLSPELLSPARRRGCRREMRRLGGGLPASLPWRCEMASASLVVHRTTPLGG